jgi:hypothetical protein
MGGFRACAGTRGLTHAACVVGRHEKKVANSRRGSGTGGVATLNIDRGSIRGVGGAGCDCLFLILLNEQLWYSLWAKGQYMYR